MSSFSRRQFLARSAASVAALTAGGAATITLTGGELFITSDIYN